MTSPRAVQRATVLAAMAKDKKRSKYRAKPTMAEGIRFDSAREVKRFRELRLLQKAGKIAHLDIQPVFRLEAYPSDVPEPTDGAGVQLGIYRADFRYRDNSTGAIIVEDVKGFKTPLYRWKKKHVEVQYGITILET